MKQVPLDRRFQDLGHDVVAIFGVHDPAASAIRTARHDGACTAIFLTSDADTQAALTPQAPTDRGRRRHRDAILSADLVVAQTACQQQLAESFGKTAVLVRNPIDTRLSEDDWLPLDRRSHVLWIGRADVDCKRADLLIQLARRCPTVPFCAVMNPTTPSTTQQLRAQMPENVRVIDQVAWEASDSLYRDAFALVNTSDSEGFPNAFLQAGKWGVPILSLRVDPDTILTRHGVGWVAKGQFEEFASRVQQFANEPQRFEHLSRAARRYVVKHHQLEERAADLAQAFLDLRLRSRPAAGRAA